MKELKLDSTYKGTRILVGNGKRNLINRMIEVLIAAGYVEISIPIIQLQDTFSGKVGEENNNLMFNFKDRGDRNVCLAPEYTAVVQQLANTKYKMNKDVKLFYVQECFRGEKPQAGRYRQFTQLGVEVLNPSGDGSLIDLCKLAEDLVRLADLEYTINYEATRGLDYYKNGKGFEISCEALGSSKQICGGGMGFAIGIDRILKVNSQ